MPRHQLACFPPEQVPLLLVLLVPPAGLLLVVPLLVVALKLGCSGQGFVLHPVSSAFRFLRSDSSCCEGHCLSESLIDFGGIS